MGIMDPYTTLFPRRRNADYSDVTVPIDDPGDDFVPEMPSVRQPTRAAGTTGGWSGLSNPNFVNAAAAGLGPMSATKYAVMRGQQEDALREGVYLQNLQPPADPSMAAARQARIAVLQNRQNVATANMYGPGYVPALQQQQADMADRTTNTASWSSLRDRQGQAALNNSNANLQRSGAYAQDIVNRSPLYPASAEQMKSEAEMNRATAGTIPAAAEAANTAKTTEAAGKKAMGDAALKAAERPLGNPEMEKELRYWRAQHDQVRKTLDRVLPLIPDKKTKEQVIAELQKSTSEGEGNSEGGALDQTASPTASRWTVGQKYRLKDGRVFIYRGPDQWEAVK